MPGDADRAREAVLAAGGTVVDDDAGALVAVGTEALTGGDGPANLAEGAPVLLVDDDAGGLPAVRRDRLEAAVRALIEAAGDVPTVALPRLSVRTPDRSVTAALDVTVQTVEPARISEFGLDVVPAATDDDHGAEEGDGAEEGTVDRLAQLRADGVVVATPAGSHGYPRAAGGPRAVGGRIAVVVPIAPFAVDPDTWVAPLVARRVRVTVERDEAAVGLFADGREVGAVAPRTPVVIGHGSDVRLVDGRRLEKH